MRDAICMIFTLWGVWRPSLRPNIRSVMTLFLDHGVWPIATELSLLIRLLRLSICPPRGLGRLVSNLACHLPAVWHDLPCKPQASSSVPWGSRRHLPQRPPWWCVVHAKCWAWLPGQDDVKGQQGLLSPEPERHVYSSLLTSMFCFVSWHTLVHDYYNFILDFFFVCLWVGVLPFFSILLFF